MNKDQQDKLRQAILEKLVQKEAEEKKSVASLTEETKPQVKLTGTEKYADAVREQVSKDNRNRQKVIPEKTDLLAGDESVTAAQLRQSNQELWNRVQSSLSGLGGGGVGAEEVKGIIDKHYGFEDRPEGEIDFDAGIAESAIDGIAWKDIAYGNERWVGVANTKANGTPGGSAVMYSSNGRDWKLASNPSLTKNKWVAVEWGGNHYVAVSEAGAKRIMYSSDGISWTQIADTSFDGRKWKDVAYGNGTWVAVALQGGAAQSIAYSTDNGVSWSFADPIPANGLSTGGIQSVTYGGGRFVAVGYSTTSGYKALYSNDGITWSEASTFTNGNWTGVTYGNGMFVACALTPYPQPDVNSIKYSTDGENWTDADLGDGWSELRLRQIRDIAFGNGYFVALAQSDTQGGPARYAYSTDLIDWSYGLPPNPTMFQYKIKFGDNLFIAAVGQDWTTPAPLSVIDAKRSQSGLYLNDNLVATEENLEPLFEAVNELITVPSVIYQDSDPFTTDSIYASNTYTNGQMWFNSSTASGQMLIRHNDSWVAI